MNKLQDYTNILTRSLTLAFATETKHQPNVRIINFTFSPERPNCLYFATFSENQKTKELSENNKIAFTTIPSDETTQHVKVIEGTAFKSEKTIFNVHDLFIQKIPGYDENIQLFGDRLVLYEIHFDRALLTLDYTTSNWIEF